MLAALVTLPQTGERGIVMSESVCQCVRVRDVCPGSYLPHIRALLPDHHAANFRLRCPRCRPLSVRQPHEQSCSADVERK